MTIKTSPDHCPTCHAPVTARWEVLTGGLVRCLILAIQAVHRNKKNRFHYMNDLQLGHTAAANFQKLRFHGLIAHADEEATRNGEWLITRRGGQFLRDEIAVPRRVKVFRNRVLDHDTELVTIKHYRGMPADFDSKFAYETPIVVPAPPSQPELFGK